MAKTVAIFALTIAVLLGCLALESVQAQACQPGSANCVCTDDSSCNSDECFTLQCHPSSDFCEVLTSSGASGCPCETGDDCISGICKTSGTCARAAAVNSSQPAVTVEGSTLIVAFVGMAVAWSVAII